MGVAKVPAGCSIKVVASRTGIRAETLRMWERRYGFPDPKRRPSGVRTYSEWEIEKLKLIARALDAGFRAGEIVSLPSADITRLLDMSTADTESRRAITSATTATAATTTALPRLKNKTPGKSPSVEDLITALLRDDVARFEALLILASESRGAKEFVTRLAHPLAIRIGELWEAGDLAIRQEHVASVCLTRRLHVLLAMAKTTAATSTTTTAKTPPTIILATLPNELHVLPLDMVAVYLAYGSHASLKVIGGNTPPREIAAAAVAYDADIVGISISSAADREPTSTAVEQLLRHLPRRTQLWIGGAGGAGIAEKEAGVTHVGRWEDLDAKLARRGTHAA